MKVGVDLGLLDRPAAFTPEECRTLTGLAKVHGADSAPLYDPSGLAMRDEARGRRARSTLLERDEGQAWLFERLDGLFAEAAAAFGLPVEPMFEPAQLVRYGPGDHFQMWHTDAGLDLQSERRISMSVELSSPRDYAGGLLEIAPGRMVPLASPPQGQATLFPSRMLHRVTPVTAGVRWSLVAWTGLDAT